MERLKLILPDEIAGLYPVEANQYEALRDALDARGTAAALSAQVLHAVTFGFLHAAAIHAGIAPSQVAPRLSALERNRCRYPRSRRVSCGIPSSAGGRSCKRSRARLPLRGRRSPR